MKMKRLVSAFLVIVSCLTLMAGCQKEEPEVVPENLTGLDLVAWEIAQPYMKMNLEPINDGNPVTIKVH